MPSFVQSVAAGVAVFFLIQQWKKFSASDDSDVQPAVLDGLDGIDDSDETTTV